jgi:hypothetical protein
VVPFDSQANFAYPVKILGKSIDSQKIAQGKKVFGLHRRVTNSEFPTNNLSRLQDKRHLKESQKKTACFRPKHWPTSGQMHNTDYINPHIGLDLMGANMSFGVSFG